jgi:short-subunit dehydrogenase
MGKEKQDPLKQTALITGASQGIGYAIAKELASRGCDLYLISLPGENLAQIALDLSREYKIHTHFMEISLDSQDNCQKVFDDISVRSIPVNILVNNAGIGSSGVFEQFPLSFYDRQMKLNMETVVFLTHLLLPSLLQKPKAFILNVSSLGAFFNMPNKEVYIATKSFILSFSKSLQNRFRGSSLHISVLCPGPVNTNPRLHEANGKLSGLARMTVMTPEDVAAKAVSSLFLYREIIIPGRLNHFLLGLNLLVPAFLRNYLINKEMNKQSDLGHELLV